jgi:selT/selW/selH-like putative selenoprotein
VELVTSGGGVFEVDCDGERVFSKQELGRFPEEGEIESKVEGRLDATAAH